MQRPTDLSHIYLARESMGMILYSIINHQGVPQAYHSLYLNIDIVFSCSLRSVSTLISIFAYFYSDYLPFTIPISSLHENKLCLLYINIYAHLLFLSNIILSID